MTVFWLILVIGIMTFLQALYYVKLGFRRVEYSRRFSRGKVFAGDRVELVEVLENRKLMPLPWVRIESRISPHLRFRSQENLDISMDQFHKSLFFLGGYSRITRTHEISCLRRGWFDCGSVSITVGDLLGLSATSHTAETGAKLLVYPALTAPDKLPEEALNWQGDITVQRWISPDPLLVTGINEYRYGDSLRDIHWGATARTGQLQVKQRDYTVSPRVLLVFNSQISQDLWNKMAPKDLEFLENGISMCAALASWCVNNGLDVGYTTNAGCSIPAEEQVYLPPAAGGAQLESILEALALTKIEMHKTYDALLDSIIARRLSETDILLITAYRSDSMEERARALRAQGNSVTVIPIEGRTGA